MAHSSFIFPAMFSSQTAKILKREREFAFSNWKENPLGGMKLPGWKRKLLRNQVLCLLKIRLYSRGKGGYHLWGTYYVPAFGLGVLLTLS